MVDSRKKQPDLLDQLLARWPGCLPDRCAIEVGLSGGLDSMVLLDLLWRSRELRHFHLSAVHVHHGLSANAEAWVEHCRRWCDRLAIELRVERVSVVLKGGDSLEAVARDERYATYRRSRADVVALAHHQDDQAETVMLQLLRGGGPHALAAMPVLRRLQDKQLWRPLLAWPRSVLERYAHERNLSWVTDESNADTRWRRNLLRHDIFPLIASAVPAYRQQLERSAAQMWQAAQVLDEVAAEDLLRCLEAGRLQLAPFATLSEARQRLLLVHWIKHLGVGEATPAAIESFRRQILADSPGRNPELQLSRGVLLRYRGQIWVDGAALPPAPDEQWLAQPTAVEGLLPGWGGRLDFVDNRPGVDPLLLAGGVWLRRRKGGERLRLEVGSKPVKTLLQEAGIPPRLRERWPLLYLPDGRLAAVPSVAVALDCRGEQGLWPQWLSN